MSLLQNLPYKEYHTALEFPKEKCEIIADLADLKISFNETKKPGEVLLKTLDRRGYSVKQYKNFLASASQVKTIITYYRPQSKVAILIANDRYQHLSKLATPSIDCDSLAVNLKDLGFLVVTVKNTYTRELKKILQKVLKEIPEDSYCPRRHFYTSQFKPTTASGQVWASAEKKQRKKLGFIFYAGHGGSLGNMTCMFGIECPTEDIDVDNCIMENFIISESAKCKPDLCVLILDVCRVKLDRTANPKLLASLPDHTVDYTKHSNILLVYSTQSSHSAYEVLQIECSTTIDENVTYELKTGDTARIVPGSSQYVNALCMRLGDNLDVSSLLDKVHGDVENSIRKQKPLKIQSGVAKRSLYDPVKGDVTVILNKIKEITEKFDSCDVF